MIERCHDDAEWSSPDAEFVPFSGKFDGKQGIAEFFSKLDATTQMLRFELREFIAEGDKVVVLGDAAWQVKATGRRFDTPWVRVFTLRDGKFSRFEALTDTAASERASRPDRASQLSAPARLHH